MKLNAKDRIVLLGVLRDRQRLAGMDWSGNEFHNRSQLGAHRLKIVDARMGIVAVNLAEWLGRPITASDSVVYSRVYKRLESKGLIQRHGRGRTSGLALTPEGEGVARGFGSEPS
jgi:hypothetical protein